jgi:hypothetical protein
VPVWSLGSAPQLLCPSPPLLARPLPRPLPRPRLLLLLLLGGSPLPAAACAAPR